MGDIISKYHLDDPLHIRFYHWMVGVLHGNLGQSVYFKEPVTTVFLNHLPATLEIIIIAGPLTILAAVKMGVTSAVHHNESVDHVTRVVSVIGRAMPNFWLGLLLLWVGYMVFSGFLPPGRLSSSLNTYIHGPHFTQITHIHYIDAIINLDARVFLNSIRHLILPVITVVVSSWALITRIMRSSMLNALRRGYITTARAKGLEENKIINKHARRNALIPVLTVSGYLVIGLLLGLFITETIFRFHGIGWAFVNAATENDYSLVIGFTLIFAVIIVTVNLIVDILYAFMDPRVRLG